MRVSNIRVHTTAQYCQLDAEVRSDTSGAAPFSLYYRFPAEFCEFVTPQNGDPFLAAMLAPAMAAGEPLIVNGSVSPQLCASLDQIQNIYRCWNRRFRKIRVEAPLRSQPLSSEHSRVGLFFSLGVDSFFSLLKNIRHHPTDSESISDLLLVSGFDVRDDKHPGLFEAVLSSATTVADVLGKTLVPVSTNLRDFADHYVSWGPTYYGAAMASVALAAGHRLEKVMIAASHTYDHVIPRGSHPLLDPLWSTSYLTFLHDGAEASRQEKLASIAHHPTVWKTLRVCYKNPNNEYNCGRCEKCLRTMIGLWLTGCLEQCQTFSRPLVPSELGTLNIDGEPSLFYCEELLQGIRESHPDTLPNDVSAVLESAISDAIRRYEEKVLKERAWRRERDVLVSQVTRLASGQQTILVDEDQLRGEMPLWLSFWPFLEREGSYWGRPSDDAAAIEELQRLRERGAEQIVFVKPTYWWLDHYSGFHDYLKSHHCQTVRNEWVTAFDLRHTARTDADGPI